MNPWRVLYILAVVGYIALGVALTYFGVMFLMIAMGMLLVYREVDALLIAACVGGFGMLCLLAGLTVIVGVLRALCED